MVLSPLNSMEKLTSGELFKMISKIYSNPNQSAQAGQDKTANEKALANKSKIENDVFFKKLVELFTENLRIEALKQALLTLIQKHDLKDDAINQVENQYGQSPLTYAFQQQDFSLAKKLMDFGAQVGPLEKASFELSLDSEAAKDAGFDQLIQKQAEFHPAKKYGQILGIKTHSQDGTSSQFAQIEPTYHAMTDAVSTYAKKAPFDQGMKDISEAFKFSNNAAAFSYSTPERIPKAGFEIAKRIQSGKITTIPFNCKGHAMGLSVVPDGPGSKSGHLVFTNRGVGCKAGESGTATYRIDNLEKISPEFINQAMSGHSKGASHAKQMALLNEVTDKKAPVHLIKQKRQKGDNCSIANPRANIHGILLCQKAITKGGFNNLTQQDLVDTKANYKRFTHDMRQTQVNELASELSKNPNDADLKTYAKDFLNQHPKADASLRAPLEKALGANAPDAGIKTNIQMNNM